MRWVAAIGVFAGIAGAQEIPFPVDRSVTLSREKVVYVVDGRRKLPWGVNVVCQRDVRVVGKNDAVLEVEGQLEIVGVHEKEVLVENVRIEPAPKFREIRLADCIFRAGSAVRTPAGQSVAGTLLLEECTFDAGCTLDVAFHAGKLTVLTCAFGEPVTIRGTPHPDAKRNALLAQIHTCYEQGGFARGLLAEGVDDLTVRMNAFFGTKAAFVNCRKLVLDGNRFVSSAVEVRQDDPARFAGVKVTKCDFYTSRFLAWAPAEAGGRAKLVLDKCWFQGLVDPDEVHAKVVADAADDQANAVRVSFQKILEEPLGLAGKPR